MAEQIAMKSAVNYDIFDATLDAERMMAILNSAKSHLCEDAWDKCDDRTRDVLDLAEAQMTACVALLREMVGRMTPQRLTHGWAS